MTAIEIVKTAQVKADERMKKHIDKLQNDFANLRTGRANLALVDGLKVKSYGSSLPIKQVATLGLSDARTIEIRPWDVSLIGEIEKAVQTSDLGLSPINDGKVIRISIPAPTEERRKELIKVVRKMAEDFRISVRNERREAIEAIAKACKAKEISEDDKKTGEHAVQKLTDMHMKKIDELLASKEKEILEV